MFENRSGTFNVQRSTRKVQLDDRKGAWLAGYGDRHDVRYTDRERSTSNVQRSTFKGLTERAHAGRDMGTDTEFCPGRDMGTDTMFDIPIRNVQRETFNSQLSTG